MCKVIFIRIEVYTYFTSIFCCKSLTYCSRFDCLD
nr:MAG TPA: hypothetical protein [Caudoviricetes sp.]